MKPIPVILDTDIGSDIDDTWALAMLLRSPELDLKLVLTDTGNTTYRAQVAAKVLQAAGRTDIPIGIGLHTYDETGAQEPWVAGYTLDAYPGPIHTDGVAALIKTIMSNPEPVTLICIGPVPNPRTQVTCSAQIRSPCIWRSPRNCWKSKSLASV